ncbi:hypothetical protein EDB89DRAFT_706581 [Lactarius sanguifluus]|nr:hypothetical protein EDB89DRAFT_706581 [Lactarius sanguifluus]
MWIVLYWTACFLRPFFSHSPLSCSYLPVVPLNLLNTVSKLSESAIESHPSCPSRTLRKHFPLVSAAYHVADTEHPLVSSSEASACSVKPGSSTQDLGWIVRRSNTTTVDRAKTTMFSSIPRLQPVLLPNDLLLHALFRFRSPDHLLSPPYYFAAEKPLPPLTVA